MTMKMCFFFVAFSNDSAFDTGEIVSVVFSLSICRGDPRAS
jgi:hypothetical protein